MCIDTTHISIELLKGRSLYSHEAKIHVFGQFFEKDKKLRKRNQRKFFEKQFSNSFGIVIKIIQMQKK